MGERARRVGENEALFRSVNEQVRGLNETFLVRDTLRIVCECGEQSCIEQLEIEPAAYETLRADPTLFAVKPGHEAPDVETVVERNDGYSVVCKDRGEPEHIARATDPRR
jgi:hypothetical protein